MIKNRIVDYGCHLAVLVEISSEESEYITVVVTYVKASHLRMMDYDIQKMGEEMLRRTEMTCYMDLAIARKYPNRSYEMRTSDLISCQSVDLKVKGSF